MNRSRVFADEVLKKNDVKYNSPAQAISGLSGGNIQKIIIGRSIAINKISLLILDEPTNGIDVGAKFEIYQKVRQLADNEDKDSRIGVMFISSELDELLNVCDRIYVFAGGDVIQYFDRGHFDKEKILSAAIRGKKADG